MVEISRILPLITETNHQAEVRKNRIVTASLVIVSILSLGFLAMAFFAFKMNKRLAKSRREIKSQNTLLDELNQKLLNTNKRRETYMHLFMDISAVYIRKLDDLSQIGKPQNQGKTNCRSSDCHQQLQAGRRRGCQLLYSLRQGIH